MAYNQSTVDKAKLLQVGIEAFELLEMEYFGTKRPLIPKANACLYQYQPQKTLVYQVKNPVSTTEEMINSHEAMKLKDGLLVLDYSKRKSAAMAYYNL